MASGMGTATIDFGSAPGASEASVVVTGIATIGIGSKAEAYFMRVASSNHSTNDHAYAPLLMALTCGDLVAGVGLTITAVSQHKMTGQFVVQYVWTD